MVREGCDDQAHEFVQAGRCAGTEIKNFPAEASGGAGGKPHDTFSNIIDMGKIPELFARRDFDW
jgi:hypothetical protein